MNLITFNAVSYEKKFKHFWGFQCPWAERKTTCQSCICPHRGGSVADCVRKSDCRTDATQSGCAHAAVVCEHINVTWLQTMSKQQLHLLATLTRVDSTKVSRLTRTLTVNVTEFIRLQKLTYSTYKDMQGS